MQLFGSLWGIAACLLIPLAHAGEMKKAEELMFLKRPLVIAHRGFSMVAPENTIPAFDLALGAGADLVELDYHHDKAGVPIVLHDATLDRTTDAKALFSGTKIEAKKFAMAELQKLDAGKWFSERYAGTKIPTLSEALDFIQERGVTLIERKAGDPAACVKLLREKNLVNEVIVQAFDWEYLADYHQLEPTQILGALGPPGTFEGKKLTDAEKVLSPTWIDRAAATGARAVVWNKSINPEAVKYAHGKNLKVWVYTINDPAVAEQMLAMGVNGIISDNPALIWKAMALRGVQHPNHVNSGGE